MSERLRPHELIATEDYWGDERERMPAIPISSGLVDGIAGVHVFAGHGAVKVMRLYNEAKRCGAVPMPLKEGDELPLLSRGEGLLRIVEDHRLFPVPDTVLSKLLNKVRIEHGPTEFDELAEQMRIDRLYRGEFAIATLEDEDSQRKARIWRVVWYMTGSKSGQQLDGIASSELSSSPSNVMLTYTVPPIAVGATYARNRNGSGLSKVIAAEVLIPGSGSREKSKSKFKVSPRPIFNT